MLTNKFTHITTAAFVFLALGTLTSVSILSGYQILFAVSVLYYAYVAFKKQELSLPKSAYFLIAFMLVALLSTVLNFELLPKPDKNFGRLKYFFYGFGGIYVFRYWINETSDQVKKNILHLFMLTVLVCGAIAIWQVIIQGEHRAKGLTHILRYGYGSGMVATLFLGLLFHRKKVEKLIDPRLLFVSFVLGLAGLYLTYTRGSLFAFICSLPFIFFFYNKKVGLTFGGLALLVVLGLGLNYLFGSKQYESRFLVNKNNPSDEIRRSQWMAAIIATKERPVLGWGLSNFHSQLKRIKHQYDLAAKDYDDAHSHNLFLEVSSGTGLIGLFFFLGWVVSWAWECFKAGGLIRALIIPFGVCWIVGSQFEVTFDANNASLIFTVYSISAWLAFKNDKAQRSFLS